MKSIELKLIKKNSINLNLNANANTNTNFSHNINFRPLNPQTTFGYANIPMQQFNYPHQSFYNNTPFNYYNQTGNFQFIQPNPNYIYVNNPYLIPSSQPNQETQVNQKMKSKYNDTKNDTRDFNK